MIVFVACQEFSGFDFRLLLTINPKIEIDDLGLFARRVRAEYL
jgi:hypothetical protein